MPFSTLLRVYKSKASAIEKAHIAGVSSVPSAYVSANTPIGSLRLPAELGIIGPAEVLVRSNFSNHSRILSCSSTFWL